jgi:hypothetical protein
MIRRLALVLMLALAAPGCDAITDVARELSLSFSTDRQNIRAGEQFRLQYEATGASLVEIVIDPGDGSEIESVNLGGSQSADGFIPHTYGAAGTYEVVGQVREFNGASRTARLTIVVAS